jgi:tRNA1Val (adenine37-N6)-methyltransferase
LTDPNRQSGEGVISRDSLFDGGLVCLQHRHGYRFSVDAVLAAHFQPPARGASLLDLGCGCGIIGLIAMYRWGRRIRHLTAFEVQPQLAELARRNFRENGFTGKCRVVCGDLRNILEFLEPESFSQVICNPPFYKEGSGRQNVDGESLLARHQILASLDDTVAAAAAVLRSGGCLVMIYPAEGLGEMLTSLSVRRLEAKRLQCVYSYPDQTMKAWMIVVSAVKNGGRGVQMLPPFYIYRQKNGDYSPAMQRLYAADPVEQGETVPAAEKE